MRIILITSILLFLLLTHCKPAPKEYPNIGLIEISGSNGWYAIFSLRIDSTKRFILKHAPHNEAPTYYTGTAPDTLLHAIDTLVDHLRSINIDTSYIRACTDCPVHQIIIHSGSFKRKILSAGFKSPKALQAFVQQLFSFSKSNPGAKTDTIYTFESYKGLEPPPMIDTIIYIPPSTEQ